MQPSQLGTCVDNEPPAHRIGASTNAAVPRVIVRGRLRTRLVTAPPGNGAAAH
jgi:hypothetical protein